MWHRSFLFCIDEAKKRGLCLYGAGYWGNVAYHLFSLFDIVPVCYCDDDSSKVGRMINHIPVLALQDAATQFPDAVYIVCVDQTETCGSWGRVYQKKMIESLKLYHVYDSNSELRLAFYLFLADINGREGICQSKKIFFNVSRDDLFCWNDLKNLAIINNMSNSGAWFFTQLLDMHSHILCLPYWETLENVYVNRLQYLEGDELIIEMTAQALGCLKSAYGDLECVGQHKFSNYCIDKNGAVIKEAYIDPLDFVSNLYLQFQDKDIKLHSYGQMLKIYFATYNNCLNRKYMPDVNYWMLYDMHKSNYDICNEYDNLSKEEFSRIENFILVREPVQHCFSWVKRYMLRLKNQTASQKECIADIVESELGKNLERKEEYNNLQVIKFEDLKYRGRVTLKLLCKYLQIPFEESLMKTTLNGIEIYFPANTKDGVKYITGFDTAAVHQKDYSEILTPWDEVRLNIIYSEFKKAFHYPTEYPSFCTFEEATWKDLLKDDFKFATIIQKIVNDKLETPEKYDVNAFVKELYWKYMKNYDREAVTYYDFIGAGTVGTDTSF